jgi:segregation and condensation protein B
MKHEEESMDAIVESAPMIGEADVSAETSEVSLAALEALLFATGDPLSAGELAELLEISRPEVAVAVVRLKERYAAAEHGLDVVEIAGGFQLGTRPEHAELIERMLREVRRVRLSPASLETLSIIAYRQPVTRAEIEAIRGVNVDGVMKTLLDRDLIRITGKKEEVGRPLLYGTTDPFLMHFGLRAVTDLPPLSEFDEIARARADRASEEPKEDWFATTESQREALEALAGAAERELADLDVKLAALKPPKVVRPTET